MADEVKLPTQLDLRRLTQWARVVYAARCARRVLPFFSQAWPDAPEDCIRAIETAVATAERAANVAADSDDAFTAAIAARNVESTAPSATSLAVARSASYAARAAADAAANDDLACAAAASAAASAAAAAVPDRGLVVPSSIKDFQLLLHKIEAEDWTDYTPIPPEVFDPLDEPAASSTAEPPATLAEDPQVKFALRAVAEPGVPAETVAKHVVEVFKALNEYTLAKYGVRVTKDEFRRLVYEHSGARV